MNKNKQILERVKEMKVGFIGLGIMGKPMAKHLLKAGIELWVFDLNREAVREVEEAGAYAATYAEIGKCDNVHNTFMEVLSNPVLFAKIGVPGTGVRKYCM